MSASRTWRGRVFIAMSLDGLIARPDSSLDWLTEPPPVDVQHERIRSDRPALGWDTFLPSVDHLVMGRGTYEKVLTFDHWPYSAQEVIVLSSTLNQGADPRVAVVRSVQDAATLLSRRGAREVYVDGGKTIQAFLDADLIDELTVTIAPVLIGNGIPLFGALSHDIRLRLQAAHASDGGMTHATYEIIR